MKVLSHFKFISAVVCFIAILTACDKNVEIKPCTEYYVRIEVENPVFGNRKTQFFIKDCNERYANIDGMVCSWNEWGGTPFSSLAEAEIYKEKIQNYRLIIKNQ